MDQKQFLNQTSQMPAAFDPPSFLKRAISIFQNSNSAIVKIGCELEFFLLTENQQEVDDLIGELSTKNWRVERERGATQIEVKTDFTDNLEALCQELEDKKNFLKNIPQKNITFASQPFQNDCGNALQFNISLHDQGGENLFSKNEKLLGDSINSLLAATNQMMIFLAPKAEDYLRFSRELNQKLFRQGKFTAPINLSFGNNNRTCAIRIAKGESGKRLEYRVAAANADPRLCVGGLLLALSQKSDKKFSPIFGNAFEEQFELANLCQSLEEAREEFERGNFSLV
jgi:glutamine synthetase